MAYGDWVAKCPFLSPRASRRTAGTAGVPSIDGQSVPFIGGRTGARLLALVGRSFLFQPATQTNAHKPVRRAHPMRRTLRILALSTATLATIIPVASAQAATCPPFHEDVLVNTEKTVPVPDGTGLPGGFVA